jgi:hypothetical protein
MPCVHHSETRLIFSIADLLHDAIHVLVDRCAIESVDDRSVRLAHAFLLGCSVRDDDA